MSIFPIFLFLLLFNPQLTKIKRHLYLFTSIPKPHKSKGTFQTSYCWTSQQLLTGSQSLTQAPVSGLPMSFLRPGGPLCRQSLGGMYLMSQPGAKGSPDRRRKAQPQLQQRKKDLQTLNEPTFKKEKKKLLFILLYSFFRDRKE